MDERKIYELLSRLVSQQMPNATQELVDECWEQLVECQQEAEYQDFSDLQHISNVIMERLDSRSGSQFFNLVNRLASLQDQGVIRRPAEMVHFINMISEDKENDNLAGHMDKLGVVGRIPDRIDVDDYDQEPNQQEQVGNVGDIIRQLHQNQSPDDQVLIQDLPYALQGLKTNTFQWEDLVLNIPHTIPFPMMGLLNQLLEPALLYRYLVENTHDRKAGLVKQSLHSAVSEELQSYLSLVGVIENQVRRQANGSESRITLRRCVVLLQDATLGLRLLYSIVEESKDLVGGQILSLLHGYTYNGDEIVSKFAKRLLAKISKPFYEVLHQWVSGGSLVDPHSEIFVCIEDSKSTWEGRFSCDMGKVPAYMTPETANKVLEIGKTLYFLRTACDDAAWVDMKKATAEPIKDYDDLERQIRGGYAQVVHRLNSVLRERFFLDIHLQGLKDYLLLGKGDFVQVLVEEVAPILDRPANRLLRHHLTSTLETAIRGSNAQHDHSEVLRSLDARMLELGHGDIGWDVFTMDYRVDKPLDVVILNRAAMTEYLRVFNFLWRIKRVSFTLYAGWRRLATGERHLLNRQPEYKANWHQVRGVYQEMMHFICEMQYYINYEVVEMAWTELQRKLSSHEKEGQAPLTVDEIIRAHQTYLSQITHKGLLGGENLMGELHEILKTMLSFRESIDGLYDTSVRLEHQPSHNQHQQRFETICTRILDLKAQFEKSVTRLVRDLSRQDDSEMRFLGVRLDFNGFYSNIRKAAAAHQ